MSTTGDPWAPVGVLAEPTRRRVFDVVRSADKPLTREAVADATGISQRLAAFHLDRLADAGLLTVDYARPPGRSGPGAGRPAKRYAPADVQLDLSVPPRRYNVVARILAAAIAESPRDADAGARAVAYREGHDIGEQQRTPHRSRAAATRATCSALTALGFDPDDNGGRLRLRNCPFHDVVDVAPELVCGLNLQLVSGVLDGLGVADRCSAQPDGVMPDCCVTVHTSRR